MNIVVTNDIKDGVFTTVVSCGELGTDLLTAEEEREILENFPCKIVYRDLDFVGDFRVSEGLPVLSEKTENTQEISMILTNQTIDINENFEARYTTSLKKTQESELGRVLYTKELVCEAKCILFASIIKEELARILDEVRSKAVGFEGAVEEMI